MKTPFLIVIALVIAWFALSELGTAAWYGSSESTLTRNPSLASAETLSAKYQARLTEFGASDLAETDVPDVAMEMLKASGGKTINWRGGEIPGGAVTILRWGDDSNVQGVEGPHNPGVCMKAAGWEVSERLETSSRMVCGFSVEIGRWEV